MPRFYMSPGTECEQKPKFEIKSWSIKTGDYGRDYGIKKAFLKYLEFEFGHKKLIAFAIFNYSKI